MSSRKIILDSLRADLPVKNKSLPEWNLPSSHENLESKFKAAVVSNKGEVMDLGDFELWLKKQDFNQILSVSTRYPIAESIPVPEDPHELALLNLAILDGQFGTAENGAIWLEDSELKLRALPFITEHLVIFLSRKNLVPDMHVAYSRIQKPSTGFGLFVAGPSKTADIEQSLVIGAHGAKSLKVVWYD